MARLPRPGSDDGVWGDILNQYLLSSHKADGSLRDNIVSEAKLSNDVRSKLNAVGGSGAVSSVNTQTGDVVLTKSDIGLANVDDTSDANKPISSATQAALDSKVDDSDARLTNQRTPIDGSVDNSKVATGANIAQSKIANLTSDLAAKIDNAEKGAADGVATLGSDGIVPASQLPAATVTPDADATTKGVVQLTGDLGGTASSPTVPGLATKADDAAVVHVAGSETVTGAKDFTGGLTVSGSNVVTDSDARLSDQRTPLDSSVTSTKLATGSGPAADQVLGYDGTGLTWVDGSMLSGGSSYITGDGIAKVTVGPTAPTTPQVGDVWISTA